MHTVTLRYATPGDTRAVLDIYAPYVRETPVTFEETVPSVEEFAERIAGFSAQFPYLVCTEQGAVTAYAYASPHMTRAAYRFDVQTSVYAAPEHHGRGMGTALYHCLFALLAAQGYYNAYAVITVPNEKSIGLHQSLGFTPVGLYHNTGYKFGAWHNVAWLEKTLTDHSQRPGVLKTPDALDPSYSNDLFIRYATMIKPQRT
jgi:phosphinothricin acetyltransferase